MVRVLIVLIAVASISCDALFGTRDAEDPLEEGARSTWQQPTSPEIVLSNLSGAFAERNVDNYMRCLTDSTVSGKIFTFFPDQEAAVSNPGAFSGWSIESERQYLTLMFSSAVLPERATSRLSFEHFTEPTIPTDTASFEEVYEIELEHLLENVPTNMRGIARFDMSRDSGGNWSIYRWRDLTFTESGTTESFPTWSEMKARAR